VRQAPAAPLAVALGIASYLVAHGYPQEGTIVMLCYCGLLRVGEGMGLSMLDLRVLPNCVILVLAITKRGAEQKVVLQHPQVIVWMQRYLVWRSCSEHAFSGKLFDTNYHKMSRAIHRGAVAIGFENMGLTSHSFRRGGASELLRRHIDLPSICLFGRWASESSAREYLRKGEVYLTRVEGRFTDEAWKMASSWAALGPLAF